MSRVGIHRLDVGDVDDANAKTVGGDVKVGEGLLVWRVDVGEDNGFGVVASDDDAVEEFPKGGFVEAAEEIVEIAGQGEGGSVSFAERPLESEDRGKGLHFDEPGSEAAVRLADETEVCGEEVGMGVLGSGAPRFRNGGEGLPEVFGVVDQAEGEVGTDLGHFVEQGFREEAGSFSDREANVGARYGVEAMEHRAEGAGIKPAIEVLPERGNHRGRVQENS